MKKVLFTVAVLAAMLSSKVYGQLPNLDLVGVSGRSACGTNATIHYNNQLQGNKQTYTASYYDILSSQYVVGYSLLGSQFHAATTYMGSVNFQSYSIASYSFFTATPSRSTYVSDSGHYFDFSNTQTIDLPASSQGHEYRGYGYAASGGRHGRLVTPPSGSWNTTDIGCQFSFT